MDGQQEPTTRTMADAVIDGHPLTLASVAAVARRDQWVHLHQDARRRIETGRSVVDDVVERQQVAYGVNTGFGSLSQVHIPPDQVRQVQRNLIRSMRRESASNCRLRRCVLSC